ncbi:MAG: nucleotidyl transferase AbiEii/AbiGii toxin family protein [Deltaproteobacteria bacterium]|nr:nucleotidyl transferase AbiEii/AbiGii toxin family protein [Deltaproteobacteria bacterium]
MKISKEKLITESQATGFRPEILEKVIHLLNLLDGFQSHPFLKNRFVLKGGTALNLFFFDLPRLSVDIDLNYIGGSSREVMLAERPKIEQAVQAVCSREGMRVTRQPTEHAGGKWRLQYDSSLGEGGNIEVDLNFVFRVPLWSPLLLESKRVCSYSSKKIPVLDLHELAAGKLAALLARQASRDLFDAHLLLTQGNLQRDKLRLGFVLYGAMNRRDWRKISTDDLDYNVHELKNQLIPVLRNGFLPKEEVNSWIERLIKECRTKLEIVLPLTELEIEFLNAILDHGEIRPELLTENQTLIQLIQTHPLLHWKSMSVQKNKNK